MNQKVQDILLNLQAADCNDELIQECLLRYEMQDLKKLIKLLQCHRCALIEKLHQQQRKIECLDYLIYCLKNEYEENE